MPQYDRLVPIPIVTNNVPPFSALVLGQWNDVLEAFEVTEDVNTVSTPVWVVNSYQEETKGIGIAYSALSPQIVLLNSDSPSNLLDPIGKDPSSPTFGLAVGYPGFAWLGSVTIPEGIILPGGSLAMAVAIPGRLYSELLLSGTHGVGALKDYGEGTGTKFKNVSNTLATISAGTRVIIGAVNNRFSIVAIAE